MKIGYARWSSGEQNLDLQRDALSVAGCGMIHEDEGVSGPGVVAPGLDQALATMNAGDALVTRGVSTVSAAPCTTCSSW